MGLEIARIESDLRGNINICRSIFIRNNEKKSIGMFLRATF